LGIIYVGEIDKGAYMNAKEWAEKLNGIEYPADEIYNQSKAIKADLKL
jgi:hypothetical protein